MSVDVPPEYGGSGQSFFASILVIEEMSKIDPSVGLFLDLQNTLLNRLFLNYGTEEQKQYYLSRMAKDLVLFLFSFFYYYFINKIIMKIYILGW
jgi:alkylation response protein AidB-like acyl-CoA dehydrogenase